MGRPDVASVSWMKGQWLVIEVITLLGWLDIRIIRSAHIVQCHWSLGSANQKPVFRELANERALMWHRSVPQIICHWPRSSQRHTDQCRCWSLSRDLGSKENPGPECGSEIHCLGDVRPCCYYWLSQASQVYITTITQAYIPLHLVCKYLSTLMIIVSVKSYEWMFMQTSDGYWKLETP